MENTKTCKNCGSDLIVKQTKKTPEQLKKDYYYTAYYYCTNCHKLYHDDKFKVIDSPGRQLFSFTNPSLQYDIEIWTDGACSQNGYPNARAAWAFVAACPPSLRSAVSRRGKVEKAGRVIGKQTNNTAESFAIYHALLWAAEEKYKKIKIYSDSQITLNNLKKSPERVKENRDIFQLIEDVIAANGLIVDYEKVPGHADNENNNRADKLANGLVGIK